MKTYDRPKIEVPKTTIERLLNWIGGLTFAAGLLYLMVSWGSLPDQVPGHYDGAGEVDRWGSKWELLVLPSITAVLTVFLSFIEKHPEWHNYMVSLNERNIEFQYRNSRQLLNTIKNLLLITFTFLNWKTIQVALGEADSLGMLFLPAFMAVTFIPIIVFAIRSFRHQ
ncbi:DUF1648 domain-containing protein [Edaphobacillus lindanitolerans]|uniref:DUF1648 domain-containing protein n=1 Tax=Edaphobacillus lindanitolerans TaxID=550447 RepID=A0A1U7PQJ9_9BACI|nr:DUF1648 domain-containing protein [Edaphobacillus lindanitolerans]SIT84273.1 Protein of unknown function [Edaphobacillus lindanitolerans]